MALPAEAAAREPQALVRDGDGSIWISAKSRGVFHLIGGQWQAEEALKPLRGLVGAADPNGNLWFGSSDGRIARVRQHAVEYFDARSGLAVGRVTAICATSDRVWVGGELGLARLDGANFVPVVGTSGEPFRHISGITSTRGGDLWLNTVGGIAHIGRAEIERTSMDKNYRVRSEFLDHLDGISGTPQFIRRTSSVVEADDGRLWFALDNGVVISIDPQHRVRNPLAPPVTIWALSSGGKSYLNAGATIQLPEHTTNLQIDYTAGSLTLPERVQFRYLLKGSDRDWQDVGNRHEALYTTLAPGSYLFRVIAANNDGVWNADGAALRFTIAPAFYQTKWFYALCGVACLGLFAALYRLRMQQVRAQVRGHLEARLGERERIARELHDTLLQGVQGLIWRFQAVADRLSPQDRTRDLMEQALERADQLLGESRDRVKDLRTASNEAVELSRALAGEGERLALTHPAQFRATVEGMQRPLHPIVREEALLIVREALANAFRHAAASHIEAEVSYGESTLQVRIRDDGRGISTEVLEGSATPGHYGLLGMRERASKLRANINVWSKPGVGTEVDLQVPARVAYLSRDGTSRFTRWYRRRIAS
jgi:signal transduction histidine kinase